MQLQLQQKWFSSKKRLRFSNDRPDNRRDFKKYLSKSNFQLLTVINQWTEKMMQEQVRTFFAPHWPAYPLTLLHHSLTHPLLASNGFISPVLLNFAQCVFRTCREVIFEDRKLFSVKYLLSSSPWPSVFRVQHSGWFYLY
jgi:hypothetical protein